MWGKGGDSFRPRADQVMPHLGLCMPAAGLPLPLSFRVEMVSAKELPRGMLRLDFSQCPLSLVPKRRNCTTLESGKFSVWCGGKHSGSRVRHLA